jgi:rhomboid protease GluP
VSGVGDATGDDRTGGGWVSLAIAATFVLRGEPAEMLEIAALGTAAPGGLPEIRQCGPAQRDPSAERPGGQNPPSARRPGRTAALQPARGLSLAMFRRQTTGSVVCRSCGSLVGVNDDRCYTCGVRNPGLWGYAPVVRRLGRDLGFVPFLVGTSVVLYVVCLLLSGGGVRSGGPLSILSPSIESLFLLGASGTVPVMGFGRWWTLLSAAWLHANLLHILFNMMWVRQLAPATAELYGPGRLVIIYTVSAVTGFGLSTLAGVLFAGVPIPLLQGARFTVGASAPIFGLLGALVYYGHRSGSRIVHSQAAGYAVALFVFGLIMPGVDNYAHAGGFAGGWLTGRLLDPLAPERLDHLVAALVCLALSVLSIIVSVVDGVRLFLR